MGSEIPSTVWQTEACRAATPAASKLYWLWRHVHLCVTQGYVVLLDLKHDKYLAVASPEELAPWIAGWPVGSRSPIEARIAPGDPNGRPDSMSPASLSKLLREGLLTADPACGAVARPPTMPPPASEFVRFQFNDRPRVKPIHAAAVGKAWLTARIARRRHSMESLVERVRVRKSRAAGRMSWDMARAREIVTAFLWQRPLYYSPRGACLLDSLVMVELLAQFGIFPTWVFGVQMAPFSAHCWIQHEDVVWSDTHERAGGYTPILCI